MMVKIILTLRVIFGYLNKGKKIKNKKQIIQSALRLNYISSIIIKKWEQNWFLQWSLQRHTVIILFLFYELWTWLIKWWGRLMLESGTLIFNVCGGIESLNGNEYIDVFIKLYYTWIYYISVL